MSGPCSLSQLNLFAAQSKTVRKQPSESGLSFLEELLIVNASCDRKGLVCFFFELEAGSSPLYLFEDLFPGAPGACGLAFSLDEAIMTSNHNL